LELGCCDSLLFLDVKDNFTNTCLPIDDQVIGGRSGGNFFFIGGCADLEWFDNTFAIVEFCVQDNSFDWRTRDFEMSEKRGWSIF
jgi:hypothetical protein